MSVGCGARWAVPPDDGGRRKEREPGTTSSYRTCRCPLPPPPLLALVRAPVSVSDRGDDLEAFPSPVTSPSPGTFLVVSCPRTSVWTLL